jgi:hypothetical protein
MNFTTDLPKRNPLVCYIVASAVRCEKFFPESSKPSPIYRMHAVILKENGIKQAVQKSQKKLELYICCHLRKVDSQEVDEPESQPMRITQPERMQQYSQPVVSYSLPK